MRPIPIFLVLSLAACWQKSSPTFTSLTVLERKHKPNENLEWQRSFPDREMDWAAYHEAAKNKYHQTAAKMADPCAGNRPEWTLEGPNNVAGRVNTLVLHPENENILLAGFSTGGIFKTVNGGDTWYPVFEEHLNLSIGILKFDPTDPEVVYCGTGDPNVPGTLFNGSGIYKSSDTGETWQLLGLTEAGIITQIAIDPTQPNIIFAATMGNPFQRNEKRGIYKTTDGGLNWERVLFVANQAGASDLQINPLNPNELYASFWDRIRTNTESIAHGPNAKIFKTTDGGNTWQQLTNGLPTGVMSRTGLVMSKQNPDKLYAVFIDSTFSVATIFKTNNGGAAWQPVPGLNQNGVVGGFGWYFAKLRLHPQNDEELFFLGVLLWRRAPGANQFGIFGGMHADVHDLVITPSGVRFSGTDGGVYRNKPNQNPWTRLKIPTTQLYHVNFNKWDGQWYGGAQDNGINRGTRQTLNSWEFVLPNDGFMMQFHQTNPNQMWGTTQNGSVWWSNDGGQTFENAPDCLGTQDRCGWDTPLIAGQHPSNKKLYAATFRVYESDADGQPNWGPISPDLTDGVIYGPRFHTVSCLSESPLVPKKLMAGTTDANVWRREPTGAWSNITGSLPNRYVTSVKLSPTFANRLYVTHSGWRYNEYIPHVHQSDDNGATWQDISNDLPNFPVNDILVLPNHRDSVLLVATDVGLYFSKNYGKNWFPLGKNLPNVPCFDLEINTTSNEIGVGTYARGLWTMPIDSIFSQTENAVFQIHGTVKTASGVGIKSVKILETQTDATGLFYLPQRSACESYRLQPFRNDSFLNGVTTFDLFLISRHILGAQPFQSPIQYLAADANGSKTVTANDIVTLRKLILGIDDTLSKRFSWEFLPANFQFSDPNDPFKDSLPNLYLIDFQNFQQVQPDFWGYKVGDVNGSATPSFQNSTDRTNGNYDIFYDINETSEEQHLTFYAENGNWAGLQFALDFNSNIHNLLTIHYLNENISAANFNLKFQNSGKIAFAAENLDAGSQQPTGRTPLFLLIFKKRVGTAAPHFPNLQLRAWVTPAAAFDANGQAKNVVLKNMLEDQIPIYEVICLQNLIKNEPLRLQFSGFRGETSFLSIFDARGQLLLQEPIVLTENFVEKSIVLPSNLVAGSYFWQVKSRVGKDFQGVFFTQ